jgi:hypothetical protein
MAASDIKSNTCCACKNFRHGDEPCTQHFANVTAPRRAPMFFTCNFALRLHTSAAGRISASTRVKSAPKVSTAMNLIAQRHLRKADVGGWATALVARRLFLQ